MPTNDSLSSLAEDIQTFANEVLYQLKNQLMALGRVNMDYQDEARRPGDTIVIHDFYVSGDASVRSIDGAATASEAGATNVSIQLQHVYKAVGFDNIRRVLSSVDLLQKGAQRVAYAVGRKVDSLIIANWSKIPYHVGEVDGSAMFNSTDKLQALNLARKVLMQNKAPMSDLQAIVNPTEAANLRALDQFLQVNSSGSNEVLRQGTLGQVFGMDVREVQDVPTATLGTAAEWGTPLVNDPSATLAIGDTNLPVDGLGASATIPAGSTFTLGGTEYTTTADATATTGAATLPISPALVAVPADNDPLTATAYSNSQSVNLAWHPDAFGLATRPLEGFLPGTGVQSVIAQDPDSGLQIRVSIQSNVLGSAGSAFREEVTVDLLAGTALLRPELAVRMHGEV